MMKFFFVEDGSCNFFLEDRTRDDIKAILSECITVKKSPFDRNTMDYSFSDGAGIYYDDKDMIIGLEIYSPHGSFFVDDINLIGTKVFSLKKLFTKKNIYFNEVEDDLEINFNNHKIKLFIPDLTEKQDEAVVESIYIAK